MAFAWIVFSFLIFKFLPWWGMIPIAIAVGFSQRSRWQLMLQLSVVSGAVAVAMAFYADGRNLGLISQRMAGLFSLPTPELMFAIQFGLSFITTLLALSGGRNLAALMKES